MDMARTDNNGGDMIDVRDAAALVRRHPETVRRWVGSGRLAAQRQGNRLLMARADVEAIAARDGIAPTSLAAWLDLAGAAREAAAAQVPGSSAADLVIEDRAQRSQPAEPRAGR